MRLARSRKRGLLSEIVAGPEEPMTDAFGPTGVKQLPGRKSFLNKKKLALLLLLAVLALMFYLAASNGLSHTDLLRRLEVAHMEKKSVSDTEKLETVRTAIRSVWKGYISHGALGCDEIGPISGRGWQWYRTTSDRWWSPSDWIYGRCGDGTDAKGMGFMVVDCLDLLWITGMKTEFNQAVEWVKEHFCPECVTGRVSFFEVTIRVVGGLLSAYELSEDRALLNAAVKIGDALLNGAKADARRKIPPKMIRLSGLTFLDRAAMYFGSGMEPTGLVDFASSQLEFHRLSSLTNDPKYGKYADEVIELTTKHCTIDGGLCPLYWYPNGNPVPPHKEEAGGGVAGLGGMADSFYEYLLKETIWSQGKLAPGADAWQKAKAAFVASAQQLPFRTHSRAADGQARPVYVLNAKRVLGDGYFEQLSCFAGGLFALDAVCNGSDTEGLQVAAQYTETCRELCQATSSGLPAERWTMSGKQHADEDGKASDGWLSKLLAGSPPDYSYRLRPEVVESYFYMWVATKDPKYRQWAWQHFVAINAHLFVESTQMFAVTLDVRYPSAHLSDRMETFWMAETLKYFYFIFSSESDIDVPAKKNGGECGLRLPMPSEAQAKRRWVLNTEAHPFGLMNDEEEKK